MTETIAPSVPGAEIVNGVAYLPGPKGNLRRVENIAAMDLAVHEQIYRMIGYAQSLSAEIARFKAHSYSDLDALDALMAQEYGVTRDPAALGNRSYVSADGKYRVTIKITTPQVAGPELQQAKALIDQIILEEGATASPVMAALVSTAFGVGKQGKVDFSRLRELRDLDVPDRRWPEVRRAITDGMKDGVSKNYITFHRRRANNGWDLIPLDMAAVEITDDAFEHPSLRREVEEAQEAYRQMWDALDGLTDSRTTCTYMDCTEVVAGLVDQFNAIRTALATVDYLDLDGLTNAEAVALVVATLNRHVEAGAGQLLDKYVQQHPETADEEG